jgi:hypothetical protein
MFSQEVVSKLSDPTEEPTLVLTSGGGDWDSAERFYQNGKFRYVALLSDEPLVEQVANADLRDDTPVVFIAAIVQEEAAETPSEPVVEDRLTTNPVPPESEPVTAMPEEAAETSGEQVSIFDPPTRADEPNDVEMDAVAVPAVEQHVDTGQIDVLPLPWKQPGQEVAGFGNFSDQVVLPESNAARTGDSPSEQQFSQTAPYDIPAGHSMRYHDPMDLVRQRAIERAENRRRRIEARKWMGIDPLRPAVTAVPYTTVPQTHPALIVIPFVVRGDR